MTSVRLLAVAAGALCVAAAGSAAAQTQYPSYPSQSQTPTNQDRIGAVLGALLGDRLGVATSVDAQWAAGRRPLNDQRNQFYADVDAQVSGGGLAADTATRLKTDYDSVAQLEARYGADGRYTTQERAELNDRYGILTQALADRAYADAGTPAATALPVADGRAAFTTRIDAALNDRRLTRVDAGRLRADYDGLVQVEADYARDGLSAEESADLDARLDGLDARLGDGPAYASPVTQDPRTRLANLETAISEGERSGAVGRDTASQLRVELGDLTRLQAAYVRLGASGDDTSYITRRLGELETRARVTR